jgi:hypothetical protein
VREVFEMVGETEGMYASDSVKIPRSVGRDVVLALTIFSEGMMNLKCGSRNRNQGLQLLVLHPLPLDH